MLHPGDMYPDPETVAHFESCIRVRGARQHNLQHVDIDIPRNRLVVFTGISGSGKSSLAFGTIFAEAQRRYFESVSPYARRLLDQAGAPAVDSIDGLPPAVALQQQRGTPNVRSSVGSITTISNLVRLLYSRAGSYPRDQPMLYAEDFSPNTPQGACQTCKGLGHTYAVDERTLVPDPSLSIRERAVAAWPHAWQGQNLRDILITLGYDVDSPWRTLPRKQRDWILYTEDRPTVPVYPGYTHQEVRAAIRKKMEPSYLGTFMGARAYVLHTFTTSHSELMKKRAAAFMRASLCPTCDGKKLKKESLSVRFAGYDIGAFQALTIKQLLHVLEPMANGDFSNCGPGDGAMEPAARRAAAKRRASAGLNPHARAPNVRKTPDLSEEKRIAAQRLSSDICQRLSSLNGLGLGYLTLDRSSPTLSPGELQRLRLATQIQSQLFGVVYVLDEPSAGLHPADGQALLQALGDLKSSGNSVLVVEHDLDIMRQADWLVDVGPGAGQLGGTILYSGPPDGLRHVAGSLTAPYLFPGTPPTMRTPRPIGTWLSLRGVTRNNVHGLDIDIPLGVLCAVTGVSGSGKSTLISQFLVEQVAMHLGMTLDDAENDVGDTPLPLTGGSGRITQGLESIARLVVVDQKPIGRTPRSNLATYTGLFDQVRHLFACAPLARARHYDVGRFSFNIEKGRCQTCDGEGVVSVELLFMPSAYAPCPTCHGARYNQQTLEVEHAGRNIAEVLQMTVDEASIFFATEAAILHPLRLLKDIGLGYLRLGQSATELSGGEAQRIKLATELQRRLRPNTLYVLDEPTTGLHPADVDKLQRQLDALVDSGSTVIVVEHDLRTIAAADWVIDLGPGAGDEGGNVVTTGSPWDISRSRLGRTAQFLAAHLAPSSSGDAGN